MDFIDELKLFSSRIQKLKDAVATEEATKNSMILPFFQMLGYDVFNPLEFVPEFTADVGIKKGEKVDYAIFIGDNPVILVEAKWCGVKLDNHDSQLFRYFGTTSAKFGILTNGIVYRFYTDLDEPNKMDLTPFMEIDIENPKDSLIPDLKRFCKSSFNIETIFSAASDLKYTSLIKQYLSRQTAMPEEEFVKFVMGEVYHGKRTQQAIEKFSEIIKRSLNQYITEVMQERFKSVMNTAKDDTSTATIDNDAGDPSGDELESKRPRTEIVTTDEERDAFALIKILISGKIDTSRLSLRDTTNYCGIIVDQKPTKWICRIRLGEKKSIEINGLEDRCELDTVDSITAYKEQLCDAVSKFA